MPDHARPLVGWLAASGVVVLWSSWVVVSRLGVAQTLTIYDIMALRFLVATVAVAPFAWRYWPRHLSWWQITVIASCQGVFFLVFAFGGLQFAPAAHAGIIINGSLPIFSALIGWLWLKDRPDRRQSIGMVIILAGCALVGSDRTSVGVGADVWVGQLMFLAAALSVAVNMIATRAWQLTAMQAMVSIPTFNLALFGPLYLAFLPTALTESPWSEILLQAIYQGLGPNLIGILMFTTAIRTIGASPTAAMLAMVPGMAALFAIPVLGEWPSELAWAGLVLGTGGILLSVGWRPYKSR
jgi:drug/metabolite transporter (DMT)-like permease